MDVMKFLKEYKESGKDMFLAPTVLIRDFGFGSTEARNVVREFENQANKYNFVSGPLKTHPKKVDIN